MLFTSVYLIFKAYWKKYSYIWWDVAGSRQHTEIRLADPQECQSKMIYDDNDEDVCNVDRNRPCMQTDKNAAPKLLFCITTLRQLALCTFTAEIRNMDRTYL